MHFKSSHTSKFPTLQGVKPPENVWNHDFQSKEKAFFDTKSALQKGHFRSRAEKSRGLDPMTIPSCATDTFVVKMNLSTQKSTSPTYSQVPNKSPSAY